MVLARSALSISIHKASHYQVFISLRSETDYFLQQRAQIAKLIDRRWPGIHHVLQIAYRTEREELLAEFWHCTQHILIQ